MGFLAAAEGTREIAKTALLVRPLAINVLISGGLGTGKTTLAKEIAADAPIVQGQNEEEIAQIAERTETLIIENFDRIARLDRLKIEGKRLIATTTKKIDQSVIDRYFGITLHLLPLCDRREDAALLAQNFLDEARDILGIKNDLDLSKVEMDLSENARSLRRSIYMALLMQSFGEKEIMSVMERFLGVKMRESGDANIYRDFLRIYDTAIIKAGLSEYGSQLKLSSVLGINRNTLRKKIYELSI